MKSLVRPELPTASVGSSLVATAAVDNSAPSATRPQSTYRSGKAVQTSGATSVRASRSALQQLLDLQRRVFTDISHDLRTPLTAVMLHTELARETSDTPELRVIAEEVDNLQRLVQDIFDLVRLETGHLKLEPKPALIGPIFDSVVTAARLGAQKRGVHLQVSADSHATLVVIADSGRLVQVMHNLVNNAIRHTPQGGEIQLKASPVDDQILIQVTDTGEGITPENLRLIFDRFWRGDDARGRQGLQRSSGLGLAIVKELVEAMGGQVGMQSKQGVGTTAEIRLPRAFEADLSGCLGSTLGQQ